MDAFIQQVINGLSVGSIYVLIGLGLTIVFGLTRLVNFAHGQLVVAGNRRLASRRDWSMK